MAQDNGRNRNKLVIQGAQNQMEQFKTDVAGQLGLQQYDQMDKGELTSRQNGYVGGNMVKKMVAYAEQQIGIAGAQALQSAANITELPERIRLMNEQASQGQSAGQLAQPQQQGIEMGVGAGAH